MKSNIKQGIIETDSIHKQRLYPIGSFINVFLMMLFALFLLPLFIFLIFFNILHFWIMGQKPISSKPYFNFDRHNIKHLNFFDKLWCEYCEWANGSLQWALAITNEIERRYCPIKTHCDPHCDKAKKWREEFLEYDHKPEDIEQYYKDHYLQESDIDE